MPLCTKQRVQRIWWVFLRKDHQQDTSPRPVWHFTNHLSHHNVVYGFLCWCSPQEFEHQIWWTEDQFASWNSFLFSDVPFIITCHFPCLYILRAEWSHTQEYVGSVFFWVLKTRCKRGIAYYALSSVSPHFAHLVWSPMSSLISFYAVCKLLKRLHMFSCIRIPY